MAFPSAIGCPLAGSYMPWKPMQAFLPAIRRPPAIQIKAQALAQSFPSRTTVEMPERRIMSPIKTAVIPLPPAPEMKTRLLLLSRTLSRTRENSSLSPVAISPSTMMPCFPFSSIMCMEAA